MAGGLPYPYVDAELHERRERVFLVLAGLFLGSMTMLNILGITRFIHIATWVLGDGEDATPLVFAVAVGVLPYPLTFLCTDFISELYGRRRANMVVWVGLVLNLWVIFILWLGGALPGFETLAAETGLPAKDAAGRLPVFYEVRALAFGAVFASMAAYLAAQFCDVYLFHFWKRLTRGRHLWLRNNGSTMASQAVDTVAVIFITYWVGGLSGVVDADRCILPQLITLILTGYAFKLAVAAADTLPFYAGVRLLSTYLKIDPATEHDIDAEEATAP